MNMKFPNFDNLNYFSHGSNKHPLVYDSEFFSYALHYFIAGKTISTETFQFCQPVLHNHTYYELHICVSGKSTFEVYDKTKIKLSKGQFVLFPPYFKHRIINESIDFSKIACGFSFAPKENENNTFYKESEIVAKNPKARKLSPSMKLLLSEICNLSKEASMDYDYELFILFISFLIKMFNVMVEKTKVKVQKTYNDKRLDDAVKFIKDNISAQLTVQDVADYVHISKKQLERLFQLILHTTPGIYMRNMRSKRINELFSNPDYSLNDIAEIMEYNDVTSMIKFITRTEGNTPKNLRNSMFKT